MTGAVKSLRVLAYLFAVAGVLIVFLGVYVYATADRPSYGLADAALQGLDDEFIALRQAEGEARIDLGLSTIFIAAAALVLCGIADDVRKTRKTTAEELRDIRILLSSKG